MNNLHHNFPGGLRKSSLGDYHYFLVGDLFASAKIDFNWSIISQLERTNLTLGEFSAKIKDLPDPDFFIRAVSRKEATLSSRIEGTQTQIEDAFVRNEGGVDPEKRDDWEEVRCYTAALDHAVASLRQMPLCSRLIKGAHKVLLNQPRGRDKNPGEFRVSQNWIGGSRPDNARFVPPAAEHVAAAMGNLEKFMHDDSLRMPHLIKAALIHYQFETIHPFLDGNGRVGRMLIPLYLMAHKILDAPILYVSGYFERHRDVYYDMLNRARQDQRGVVDWVSFFLDAVYETAAAGATVMQNILNLKHELEIGKIYEFGGRAKNAKKFLDFLFLHPVVRSSEIKREMEALDGANGTDEYNFSVPLIQKLLKDFVRLGILREVTGKKRNRLFVFEPYMNLLRD